MFVSEVSPNPSGKSASADRHLLTVPRDERLSADPINRAEYALPRVPGTQLALAEFLANESQTAINRGVSTETPRWATLRPILEAVAARLHSRLGIPIADLNNPVTLGLAGYFCAVPRPSSNYKGFPMVPAGLFNDPTLKDAYTVITRYAVIEVLGLRTAADLEAVQFWLPLFDQVKLDLLVKKTDVITVLKNAFPKEFEGVDPPIREWCVFTTRRWKWDRTRESEIEALAKRACKWVVRVGESMLRPDGTYDIDRIRRTPWGQVFSKPEYRLGGMVPACAFTTNSMEALKLGAPGLIGLDREPLRPWNIVRSMWGGVEGLRLEKELTIFLIEKKFKLVDAYGRPDPETIRAVADWSAKFEAESPTVLRTRTAYQALQHAYPHLFGWGENQIRPGEVRHMGMWDGTLGRDLLRLRAALAIRDTYEEFFPAGRPLAFDPSAPTVLEMTPREALRLRDAMFKRELTWLKLFQAHGLTHGIRTAAEGSMEKTIALVAPKSRSESPRTGVSISDCLLEMRHEWTSVLVSLTDGAQPMRPLVWTAALDFPLWPEAGTTGIEATAVAQLFTTRRGSEFTQQTGIIYTGFKAALSQQLLIGGALKTNGSNETSLIRPLLLAAKPGSTDYLLSDNEFQLLIKTVRTYIVPHIANETRRRKMDSVIGSLLTRIEGAREVLLSAIELDPDYTLRTSGLSELEACIGKLFLMLQLHEIRWTRLTGKNTQIFATLFNDVAVEGARKEEAEEGADSNELADDSALRTVAADSEGTTSSETDSELLPKKKTELLDPEQPELSRNFFYGLSDQDPRLDRLLSQAGKVPQLRMVVSRLLLEGDPIAQMHLIREMGVRLDVRHAHRFDYSTLRVRAPHEIDSVLTLDPSMIKAKELALQLSDAIDRTLWGLKPVGWPVSMIPIRFYANTVDCLVDMANPPSNAELKCARELVPTYRILTHSFPSGLWKEFSSEEQKFEPFVHPHHALLPPRTFLTSAEQETALAAVHAIRCNLLGRLELFS